MTGREKKEKYSLLAERARFLAWTTYDETLRDPLNRLANDVEQMNVEHDVLLDAACRLVDRGPPMGFHEDSSVGFFSCCGEPEYRDHKPTCWWNANRLIVEEINRKRHT